MICTKKALFYCLVMRLQNRECKRVSKKMIIEGIKEIFNFLGLHKGIEFVVNDRRMKRLDRKKIIDFQVEVKIINKALDRSKVKGNVFYIRLSKYSYTKIEFFA